MFNLETILLGLPGAMLALSMHQFGKAYASDKLGDPNPRLEGKLTLNPMVHLDPIGFFMIMLFHFGWSNSVNINPSYYKNTRKGLLIAFSSGTIANIALAGVTLLLYKIILATAIPAQLPYQLWYYLSKIISAIISINIGLGLFWLLPIPHLDGFYLLTNLLPRDKSEFLYKMEPYSMVIFMIILFTGIVSYILFIPTLFVRIILNLITEIPIILLEYILKLIS